jgi:uncharacterized protein YwgA
MERFERESLLTMLVEALNQRGSWSGNTHIQKSAFFLQDLGETPLDYDFVIYRYGPFSFELRDDINDMRVINILDRYLVPAGYGVHYCLGSTAKVLLDAYKEKVGKYEKDINFIVEKFGSLSASELELLATLRYVFKIVEDLPEEKIFDIICKLKPHFSLEETKAGWRKLEGIIAEIE